MKKENLAIEVTLNIAAENFQKSIEMFYPSFDKNGFTEHNLTYYICEAFRSRYQGYAFMEVPFKSNTDEIKKNRNDTHFDAYVFNDDIGIFIEAKRLYSLEKLESIKEDIFRINENHISTILKNPNNSKYIKNLSWPKNMFKLIIAEVWATEDIKSSNNIINWWNEGKNGPTKAWDEEFIFFSELIRKNIKIKNYNNSKDGTLYWVYGYSKLQVKATT